MHPSLLGFPCFFWVPHTPVLRVGLGFGCPRFDFLPGSWVSLVSFGCPTRRVCVWVLGLGAPGSIFYLGLGLLPFGVPRLAAAFPLSLLHYFTLILFHSHPSLPGAPGSIFYLGLGSPSLPRPSIYLRVPHPARFSAKGGLLRSVVSISLLSWFEFLFSCLCALCVLPSVNSLLPYLFSCFLIADI